MTFVDAFMIVLTLLHVYMTESLVAIATTITSYLFIETVLWLTLKKVIKLSIPYTSTNYTDTQDYAQTLAHTIIYYHQQGKKVVIRLVGDRGSGKSAIVSEVLKCLTCDPDATDFGTISFIGVKEYTIQNGSNKSLTVVHIDPDIKGHQRLKTMHSPYWNVLLLEHGTSPAYKEHNDVIKDMGDDVVDATITITMESERTFTLTTATDKPIETPQHCKWKGQLTPFL